MAQSLLISYIRKTLFPRAKGNPQDVLRKEEMDGEVAENLTCEEKTFHKINKEDSQSAAGMIITGSRGNSGGMKNILLGGTAGGVLRFLKRRELCISLDETHGAK